MQKLLLSALSVAAVFCGAVCAQTYPAKPVRIIMGFPAGSTVDVLVRPLAQRLTDALGQSFIVDNRSGATGIIASELVAKAAPDGYTLLGTPSSAITSTPPPMVRVHVRIALRESLAGEARSGESNSRHTRVAPMASTTSGTRYSAGVPDAAKPTTITATMPTTANP